MARAFQDDPAAAEPLLRRALEVRKATLETGHPDILEAQVRLGQVLIQEDKSAEAEPLLREAMQSAERPPFPLVGWQIAEAENALGSCLLALHRPEEGKLLLEKSRAALQTDPRPAFRRAGWRSS
jgi:hypothetical protein